jgi:hypothetical protein
MIYNPEFEAWFPRQTFPAATKDRWSLIWNGIGGNAILLNAIIATIQEGQADTTTVQHFLVAQ